MGFKMVVSRWLLVVCFFLLAMPAFACKFAIDNKEHFKKLDKNSDTILTEDEFYAAYPKSEWTEKEWQNLTSSSNGKLPFKADYNFKNVACLMIVTKTKRSN